MPTKTLDPVAFFAEFDIRGSGSHSIEVWKRDSGLYAQIHAYSDGGYQVRAQGGWADFKTFGGALNWLMKNID
jgi:hypothetical protein